jgi:hypothetical protein
MKFTEAQLEANEPKGSNDECSVMSSECLQRRLESGQRSRHKSRQMARFPSSKRKQITNRDKNHDTLSRFGVMQAAHRLIATFAEAAEKKANPRYEASAPLGE